MNIELLFLGILPLLVFVIVDSFAGIKAGVVTALIIAALEVLYSLVVYQKLDELSMISLGLFGLFGYFSLKTKNRFFFKIQPVVLGGIISAVFLVMEMLDKHLLVVMFDKYQYMLPDEVNALWKQESMRKLLEVASLNLGISIFLHAAILFGTIYLSSPWWWLLWRGIGLYLVMGLSFFLSQLSLS